MGRRLTACVLVISIWCLENIDRRQISTGSIKLKEFSFASKGHWTEIGSRELIDWRRKWQGPLSQKKKRGPGQDIRR